MSSQSAPTTPARFSRKVALTAGAVSGALFSPAAAEGALTTGCCGPILSLFDTDGTTVQWNADANAVLQTFELFKDSFYSSALGDTVHRILLASATESGQPLTGRGLVGPVAGGEGVQPLAQSFRVGPTLASSLAWGAAGVRSRTVLSRVGTGPVQIGADFAGFSFGTNRFGFRFDSDEDPGRRNYAWGTVRLDSNSASVRFFDWTYENDTESPVHVGETVGGVEVPEPSSLALLASGAAGLFAWRARRRRRDKASAEPNED